MFPSSCEFGLALSNVELKSEGDFKSYMVFCFMVLHVIMLPPPSPRGPPHCPWHPSQSSDSPAMQHQVRAPSCRGLLLPRGFPLPPAPLVSVFQDRMLRALHYILCWNPLLMASPPSPLPAWEEIHSSCKALPSPDENSLIDRKQGTEQECCRVFQAKTPPGRLSAAVPPEASQVFSMNTNQKFDSLA